MLHILRSVLALATASITVGALAGPGAAYAADPTAELSAAAMGAELKAVGTASMSAARSGWQATMSLTSADLTFTGRYVVDPAGGAASDVFRFGGKFGAAYAVAGKGTYAYTDNPTTLAAVRMIGRPAVRYVFTPKAVSLDDFVAQDLQSPAALLAEDVDHAGTKSVHDDGSRDYTFQDQDGMPVAIHVNPAGVFTSARAGDQTMRSVMTYGYGAQHVALPATTVVVDARTLAAAVAYLTMPAGVQQVASQGAAHTLSAAKHGTVRITSLRTIVRRDVVAFNATKRVTMIKVGDISGGTRVSATNPWTHATVSYTIKAAGGKVLVAKG